MDSECTNSKTEADMKGSGGKIKCMESVLTHGRMGLFMKESSRKISDMEKDVSDTAQGQKQMFSMKENLKTIQEMDLVD